MLFNSLAFLLFLVVVFTLYWVIPAKHVQIKAFVLLAASYFFYGMWDFRFLGLIVASTLTDYFSGIKIDKSSDKSIKKKWLWLSLLINLGILGYFKYYNFFIENLVELGDAIGFTLNYTTLQIILPVGISFYTFQSLSYTIDIYYDRLKPTRNIVQFSAFVAFFPQLVAGPIERAALLLPQFSVKHIFNYKNAMMGLILIIYGYFKKVAIADNLAPFVTPIFDNPDQYSTWQILGGLIGFAFQVYTDFSGYSDIAIGLALLFGYKLSTNFRTPFFSSSIKEFWSRWHISLYSWFRDYVYVPLGGNRKGKYRTYLHILIVFFLSGFWHGANWNYIFFGLIHGLWYLLEYRLKWTKWKRLSSVLTGFFVMLSFAVFRPDSLEKTGNALKALFNYEAFPIFGHTIIYYTTVLTLIVFNVFEWRIRNFENFGHWVKSLGRTKGILVLYFIIFWTLLFGAFDTSEHFIYFQF